MPPPVHKPASVYLTMLKVVLGVALMVATIAFMIGTTRATFWLLGLVGANAAIMIVLGIVRAVEQSRARVGAKALQQKPAPRRMAGIGR